MIHRALTRLRRRKLLTPYLFSFLLITGMAIALLCLWFALNVRVQLRREIQEGAAARTQRAAASFENSLSDFDALSSKLSRQGALTPNAFAQNPIQAYQTLSCFDSTLRYDDLLIFYPDSRVLLSAFGTSEVALYFSHVPQAQALVSEIGACAAPSFLSTASYGVEPGKAQLLYVQPLPMQSRSPSYYAVYILNSATLDQRILGGAEDGVSHRSLYAADGTLLWSNGGPESGSLASDAVETHREMAGGKLALRERVEAALPSARLDWAWRSLMVCCALLMVSGCGLALWSMRRGYRPIQRMLADYGQGEASPARSDIEALGHMLQRYHAFLRQRAATRDHLPAEYVEEMLALSLAHGHVQESGYLSELGICDLSAFDGGNHFVCLVLFDRRPTGAEIAAVRSALQGKGAGFCGLCAAAGPDPLILCVIHALSPDAAARARAGGALLESAGLRATCACGRAYDALQNLPQSYREASAALENRGAMGCHTVILYDELPEKSREDSHPAGLLAAYAQALGGGDFEGARSGLAQLCERVRRQRLDMQACMFICFELISHTEGALQGLFGSPLPEALGAGAASLDGAMSVPELAGRLEELLCAAQAEWARLALQKDEEFLNLCLQVLRENIGNADFSVESVAGQLGTTAQTLRRRFKLLTGSTLIGKLAELRIEEAKRLLSATELEIAEITRRVGYLDTSNFSRLFKRAVGVSPSQFRSLCAARAG